MINILLLSESNKLKGYGQLMRSIALAIALNKNRETKIVFIFESDKKTVNILNSYSFEYKLIPEEFKRNYASFLIDFINKLKIKILIIDIKDNYLFEALSTIKSQGVLVVCIDDGFDKRLHANLIFYPPVHGKIKLNNFNGNYVGWEWILIREDLIKTNKPILNRR